MQPGMFYTQVMFPCPFHSVSNVAGQGYWVDLIGQEASSVVGKGKKLDDGRYITGLYMFHQLHCVVSPQRACKRCCSGVVQLLIERRRTISAGHSMNSTTVGRRRPHLGTMLV
jgi:hypothetical protein